MEKGAKTSFQKKGTPKFPSIPGTKPSLFNFLLLTSTGVPSLDNLLGGGVPVGTILLVEDQPSQPSRHQEHAETEKGGDYSNILMKYFSAEGAFNHHGLFYGSCNEDPENFLANIPESVKTQTIGGDTTAATDEGENSLKIAWRYQNQSSGNQVEKIGHHFNLQKTLTKEKLQNIKTNFWSPAKDNFDVASLYPQVFERLQNVAKCEDFTIGPSTGDNEKNILRVCIHDLGSILWSENSTDVTKFVHALRSLARQHLMVCLLTISEDSVRSLLNKNATLTRLRSLCDVVIQLTSFNKDERQNGIFKDHHGILDIIKIQNLNCLRSPVQQNTDPDYYRAETPAPWERVLGIPGIDKCRLQGNDSPEVLETSSIVMASLGPEFEKVLKCDDDDDVAKLDHPFDVINSLHTLAKTGQCELDTHRLLPMLKAAVEFKVNQLRQILGQYLVDNLTLDNALNTHALVQEYLCEHIRLKVVAFILVNFDQLSCSDKFLRNCPQDLLKEMLKEDRLNLDEKDLLLTLVRWASFNPPYRLCLQDLLLHLRFPIMPNSFLESVTLPGFLQEQLPQASPRELQSLESTLDTLSRRALKMVLPKYFRLPNEFILAVGGFHILPTHSVETLDVRAGEWSELAELQKIPCHAYHGLVFDQIGSKVYVIGGYGKATYYRSTHCLDLKTLKWTRKSSMRVKRCYVSTVALGSNIFAMGGFDGLVRSKSVEFFDPDTNQWENGPSMHIVRSDASAVVFKGKIIILGGFTGQEVLTSTEIYDPQKQEWTFGPRMSVARSGLKAVLLNNKIYAIGGYDGHERLSSVECLDLSKPGAEWTQVKRMITPRSNFGATVFQDRIVVAGGFDGNGVINLAEAYSEENNEWTSFPDLTITKSALNMISIKG